MSAHNIPVASDFKTRAKTNDVPVAHLIGFETKEIAAGRATVTLAVGPQHANPMGTLHGGILCDILRTPRWCWPSQVRSGRQSPLQRWN